MSEAGGNLTCTRLPKRPITPTLMELMRPGCMKPVLQAIRLGLVGCLRSHSK